MRLLPLLAFLLWCNDVVVCHAYEATASWQEAMTLDTTTFANVNATRVLADCIRSEGVRATTVYVPCNSQRDCTCELARGRHGNHDQSSIAQNHANTNAREAA